MGNNAESIDKSSKSKVKSIAIAKDLHAELKRSCNAEGLSMGTVVAILIRKYLNGQIKL